MERKYRTLRIVATVFKILAWLVLVLGIIGAIALLMGSAWLRLGQMRGALAPIYRGFGGLQGASIVFSLLWILAIGLGSVLNFLFLYAAGEMIGLLIDIEQNTREAAIYAKPGS